MPKLYLIGGPNGIGKSSQAFKISNEKGITFINADTIILESKAINPDIDESALLYLIKLNIEEVIENNESFIYESNLHNLNSYDIVSLVRRYRYDGLHG